MAPKVSVGVPVYNGDPYLAEALQSIADQTFADFEVVISDNASTDGTETVCREVVARDPRFRYVRQEHNRGAARNYNDVLALAAGEYFKWASHDDLIAPTFLERCVGVLDAAPLDVVLVYPKSAFIDAEGRLIEEWEDELDLRMSRPSTRFDTFLRNHEKSHALFGLHRIERLRATRQHGNYVGADAVLLAEIALSGQVWEIPERLFFRRDHPAMSMRANVTDAELTEWFDPSRGTNHVMPRTRLFAEDLRAIGRARMSVGEKARCVWSLASIWGPLYWRVVGGEFKRELKAAVR
jgi:glycosyltransferase involved in cell wall biosynthesis